MSAIIFDTEVADMKTKEIIQAGWARIEHPQALSAHPQKVFIKSYCPEGPVSIGAMAVHHLSREDLIGCPPSNTFTLPDVDYLVGHNVDFDWEACGSPAGYRRICTLAMARNLYPDIDSHSLVAMAYFLLGTSIRELVLNAHNALTDVSICQKVLAAMMPALADKFDFNPDNVTWQRLWEISEACRIPTHISFGKHKGSAIKDIPLDYRKWLLKQDDVDPYLRKALVDF